SMVQTMAQDGTTATLSSSTGAVVFGQAATWTVQVTAAAPGQGMPTGGVTFVIDGVSESPITLVNGQAAFTVSSLLAGHHSISATYSGDTNFQWSAAAALDQFVAPADTSLSLS